VQNLLFKSIIVILWVINNSNNWGNLNERLNKRETLAYDPTVIYLKKSFGQRLVDYLGPIILIICLLLQKKHYL